MLDSESLTTRNSVSYTHLDVYKRQKVTRTALQSAASVAALILITEATINEIPKEGPDPVSYTHLDVYKRQVLGRRIKRQNEELAKEEDE